MIVKIVFLALLLIFPGPFWITRLAIGAGGKPAGWACLGIALVLSSVVWLQFGYLLMTWKLTSIAAAVFRFYYWVAMALPLPGLLQVGLACAIPSRR